MQPDPRDAVERRDPSTGSGDGAPRDIGYGRGGLGAEQGETGDAWDAPGVTPDGRRTGSPTDGPRTAMDGEGEPDPDHAQDQ